MSEAANIRTTIRSAISAELSDWDIMQYPRFPEKNGKNSVKVFNVLIGSADSVQGAGSGGLVKKFTTDQDFVVVLATKYPQKSMNEIVIDSAEATLLDAAESIVDIGYIAKFNSNRIITLNSFNYSEFEILEDNNLAILRLTLNVKYRYSPANLN